MPRPRLLLPNAANLPVTILTKSWLLETTAVDIAPHLWSVIVILTTVTLLIIMLPGPPS